MPDQEEIKALIARARNAYLDAGGLEDELADAIAVAWEHGAAEGYVYAIAPYPSSRQLLAELNPYKGL